MKKQDALIACVSAAALLACLAGCSTQSSMSPEEAAHIKGGPMPPEAAKQMAAQRAQWDKTHKIWSGPTSGAPGGPPPGAGPPGVPGGPPPGSPPAGAGSGTAH